MKFHLQIERPLRMIKSGTPVEAESLFHRVRHEGIDLAETLLRTGAADRSRDLQVAALWDEFLTFIRIGNRSYWGSVRPREPGRPLQKVGASPGPLGPPRLLK